jgi:RNA polymerase sigma factor (sigma-70 family)
VREHTDGELIGASVGDPELFEVIFERHFDLVRRYAQRRVGVSTGEEVAAKTFLIAFEQRATFRTSHESARAWLLGIATNLIRHHVRDEHAHLRILEAMPRDVRIPAPDDEDRLVALGLWPMIAHELRALPEGDREVFLLLVLGDLSYEEIAEALAIPIGTVRSRIHRVRTTLRERLGSLGAIPVDDGEQGGERRG